MNTIAADWQVLKCEAEIVVELLSVTPADSAAVEGLVSRARTLTEMGMEARALLEATRGGAAH